MIHEKNFITPAKHVEVRKEKNIDTDVWKFSAEAIVIGSGAGGAVVARELSAQKWKVVLIEEGSFFSSSNFIADEFVSLKRLYRDSGFIYSEDQTISILQGRTLGGSSTVGWQTCIYPPDSVTNKWINSGWYGYTEKEMLPFIEEIHKKIEAFYVKEDKINPNNQVLIDGAKKLGLNHYPLKNNNNMECQGLGRCGLGCPVNAKKSLFLNYIPEAVKNGTTVITNMRVAKIKDGGRIKTVYAEFRPDIEEKTPEGVFLKCEIDAPVVIVCAGAIESPYLLLKSKIGNSFVGKNLKLNPSSVLLAKFPNEIKMYNGIPQSVYMKDELSTSEHRYWFQVAPLRPTLLSSFLPFYGEKHFNTIKDFNYFHAGTVSVSDGVFNLPNASVKLENGKRKVYFKLTESDGNNMRIGLKLLAEILQAAGAIELTFPFTGLKEPVKVNELTKFDWVLQEKFDSGHLLAFSTSPHGSIQAAKHPKMGALNNDFEVWGHKNIFVMDSSVFPTGLSVSPQTATMAVILKAARKLANEKSSRLKYI